MKECSICMSLIDKKDRFCPFCGYLFRRKSPKPEMTQILLRMEQNSSFLGSSNLDWYYAVTFGIGLFLVLDAVFLLSHAIANRLKPTSMFVGLTILIVVAGISLAILRERLRYPRRKGNLLLKSRVLSGRIAKELEKIINIDNLLKNIYQPQIRAKVLDAKEKIESLVDSLITCKVNLDFLRLSNDYSIIDRANKAGAFTPELLSQAIAREDDKLKDWKTELQKGIDRPITLKAFTEKLELAKAFKEQISLNMVSTILSSTSRMGTESLSQGVPNSEEDIDQEIERINYEIDRLDAEFELEKLH